MDCDFRESHLNSGNFNKAFIISSGFDKASIGEASFRDTNIELEEILKANWVKGEMPIFLDQQAEDAVKIRDEKMRDY